MSNYNPLTDFAAKDSLSSGDPNKRALGTHVSAELAAIATAISTKADTASPTFSGTTTAAALTVTGALSAGSAAVTGAVTAATATISGALSAGATSLTGDLTVAKTAPIIAVDATGANDSAQVHFKDGGVLRWMIQRFGPDGNLYIGRHDSAGVAQNDVLTVSQATGLMTVAGDPTAALGVATKQYVDGVANEVVASGTLSFAGSTVTAGSLYAPAAQSIGTVAVGDIVIYEVRTDVTSFANADFFYARAFSSGFADSTEGYATHRYSTDADLNGVYVNASTSRMGSAGAATMQPMLVNVSGATSLLVGSITVKYAVIRP